MGEKSYSKICLFSAPSREAARRKSRSKKTKIYNCSAPWTKSERISGRIRTRNFDFYRSAYVETSADRSGAAEFLPASGGPPLHPFYPSVVLTKEGLPPRRLLGPANFLGFLPLPRPARARARHRNSLDKLLYII